MLFAASKFGSVAASKTVYCRAACSDVDTEVGKITRAKITITITSRTTSVPNMMARSFVKIDGRHREPQKLLVIAASNEEVAGAAYGTDKRGVFRVVSKFLTNTADQHVDGSIEGFPVDPTSLVDDSISTKHAAAVPDEQSQKLELGARESEITSAHVSGPLGPIYVEIAKSQSLLVLPVHTATQDCLHAREEFPRFEGLGKVVVGAQFKSDDAIGDISAGGEHD